MAPHRWSLLLLLVAPACGVRQVPYRFEAPLVRSVAAAPLPEAPAAHPVAVREHTPRRARAARRLVEVAPPAVVARGKRAHLDLRPVAPAPPPPSVRRAEPAAPLARPGVSGDKLAATLRAMVGVRDDAASDVRLAIYALRLLGARVDSELADIDSGSALVALAEQRRALVRAADGGGEPPRLGDLLVFDRVVDDDPATLVAIAVSVDDRGVVEFIYLARGVVRRGFLFAAQPDQRRDAAGRVLNTFVRHSDGRDRSGTRHLAGQLYSGTIPLAALLR